MQIPYKYHLILIALLFTAVSCGRSNTANGDDKADSVNAVNTAATPDNTAIAPGLALINKSDCVGCHKQDVKLVGPAYNDIAAKYADNETNIAMLAEKITKGGKGNWGEIPMTGHPQLLPADSREMVKYILSLRKK